MLIQQILAVTEPRISERMAVNDMQGIIVDRLQIITINRSES